MAFKLNVFEGARRISLLVGVLWAVGVAIAVWNNEPYLVVRYDVLAPNAAPIKSPDQDRSYCASEDTFKSKSMTAPNGSDLNVHLCFKARRFDNGRMLVPYKIDPDGTLWGAEHYSNLVTPYAERVTRDFQVPKVDEEWLKSQYWPKRRKQFGEGTMWLVGGWIALWVFTFVVGWIVRGFTGIPMGRDRRPEKDAAS